NASIPSRSSFAISSGRLAVAKTRQPSALSARAQYAPIPEDVPVIRTVRCVFMPIPGSYGLSTTGRASHTGLKDHRLLVSMEENKQGSGVFYAVRRVIGDAFGHFNNDDGWAMASHLAISAIMALFPFLIFATALASFLGADRFAE